MAEAAHIAETAEGAEPERLFVKWATPADEAVGTAKLAGALVDRRVAKPARIAIAAPNRTWAVNLLRACASVGVRASLCIPRTCELEDELPDEAEGLRGFSLAHRLGWDKRPELAHALLHVEGDEDFAALRALVRGQLAEPTVPDHTPAVPVMLMDDLRSQPDYLFIAGCVNGLVPTAAALEDDGLLDRERAAFTEALSAGRVRTTLSCFVKAPAELAEHEGLSCTRFKMEDGRRLAMTQPTLFLTEAGAVRPTTTGGQALLRTYGLN